MPKFQFKDRDGNVYDVEAPEGATEGQAYEKFKAKLGSKAEPPKPKNTSRASYASEAEQLGGLESLIVNLGAGMSNVVGGTAQALGAKKPGSFLGIEYDPTDEGVRDKRERDDALAQETTGGGLTQIIGEILPTLAIPAGGFVKGAQLGAKGIGAIARAMGITGEATAAKAVAPAMGRGLASLSADTALAGGVAGATGLRTSDESRGLHAAGGATLGAVVPGAMALVGKLVNLFRTGHAQSKAATEIIEQLGGPEEAEKVILQVKQQNPNVFVADVPLTTAETVGNPTLAAMERSSANNPKQAKGWTNFRGEQAEARADAFTDITRSADDLEGAITRRNDATGPMRSKALGRAEKDPFFTAPLVDDLARIEKTPAVRANDGALSLVNYVRKKLDAGVDPETLYEVRKYLVGKMHGPPDLGDPLTGAARQNKETVKALRGAIDNALDQSTNGQWSRYLKKFQLKSGEVEDATASKLIRETFERQGASRIATGHGRSVPDIGGKQLGNAIEDAGEGEFGQRFADRTLRALTALRDNLGKTEDIQRLVKKGAGGSENVRDFAVATAEDAILPPLSKARRMLNNITGYSTNLEKAALAEALQRPEQFVKIVQKKLDAGKPLSRTEDFVLRVLRGGVAAGSAEMIE
jgi:hypothetical protein